MVLTGPGIGSLNFYRVPLRISTGIFLYYHLIVTDDCNLCCSYCRGKAFDDSAGQSTPAVEIDESLPPEPVYALPDLYAFLSKDPAATVTFYGGEPLLRTGFIREIMDNAPVNRFMIQTNGILLDRLGQDYVNRFSTILVSLDGNEQLTDAQRGRGTYQAVMRNVRRIVDGGYRGELIARMTVTEDTGIMPAVISLASNTDHAFTSIHWQLDANFSSDFSRRNFASWTEDSYNPGIRTLVRRWVELMATTGKVMRWYPFLDPMDDLLQGKKSGLRCGAGHANYSIMTDGNIAPCPIMTGMSQYYVGDIRTTDPADLPRIPVGGECPGCHIRNFCGGRCLYASIVQPWNERERRYICRTVENLHDALEEALPQIQTLIANGRISMSDFSHEKFNGCEIIP